MTVPYSDTVVLLAKVLPRLLYLGVAAYFLLGVYHSLKMGCVLAFEERIERVSRPQQFWFSLGLMTLVGCICLYGAFAGVF